MLLHERSARAANRVPQPRGLAAGDREAAVGDVVGDTGYAQFAGMAFVGAHVLAMGIPGQDGASRVGVQPGVCGDRGQRPGIEDGALTAEMRPVRSCQNGLLAAAIVSEMRQPVGVERAAVRPAGSEGQVLGFR